MTEQDTTTTLSGNPMVRTDERRHRRLFLVFFAVGVATILGGKFYELSAWIATGIPVALLCLFASMASRGLHLRESAGDSSYYLGFLYTLTSIVGALSQFKADADLKSIEFFIHNFGIALSTTIVGLVLRILYPHDDDPSEIEAHARYDLAQAANSLRREIDRAIYDVRGLGTDSLNLLRPAVEEIVEATKLGIAAATEEVRGAAHGIADAIQGSGTEVRRSVEDFREQLTRSLAGFAEPARELSDQAGHLIGAMETVVMESRRIARDLNAIEVPPDTLAKKIDPVLDALAETVDQHGKALGRGLDSWKGLESVLHSTAESMRAIDAASLNFAENIESAGESLATIDAAMPSLGRLAGELAALEGPLRELGQHVSSFSGVVARANLEVGQQGSALGTTLAVVLRDILQHSQAMNAHRELLASELDMVSGQARTMNSAASDFAGSVKEHGANLRGAAEAQAEAGRELQKVAAILREVEPSLNNIRATALAMQDAAGPVEAAAHRFQEMASTIGGLDGAFARLGGSIAVHGSGLEQVSQTMEDQARRIRQHGQAMDADVEKARGDLQQFQQSLLGLVKVITSELNASGR